MEFRTFRNRLKSAIHIHGQMETYIEMRVVGVEIPFHAQIITKFMGCKYSQLLLATFLL